jgi:hypothetical protein
MPKISNSRALFFIKVKGKAPCCYVITRSFKTGPSTLTKIEGLIEVEDDRDNEFVEVEKVR